eukprot:gb/GECG01015641.1/.p1 GENE.gb/GECG01015641.1/~~gb/GECG01015641.1/.p1  ORF type:complete len:405 (+),score=40.75 gb/GECG01015641.1/:1-1215(+)
MAEHSILPPTKPSELHSLFPTEDLFAGTEEGGEEEEDQLKPHEPSAEQYYGPHIDTSDIQGCTITGDVESRVKRALEAWDRTEEDPNERMGRESANTVNMTNERVRIEYENNQHLVNAVPEYAELERRYEEAWPNIRGEVKARKGKSKYDSRGPSRNVIPPAIASATPSEREQRTSFARLADDEVIIRVVIYHYRDCKKRQEFLVLGSQPLTILRDRIYCLSDNEDTFKGAASSAAYFYIDGICYDDCRPIPGTDGQERTQLSEPVIDWSRAALTSGKVSGWGLLESKAMEKTRFNDLTMRLGAHYLFCHQGDCQHILVFTDMRTVTRIDELNENKYPIHTFQTVLKRSKCAACPRPAECLLYGDSVGNNNPTYYCSQCFHRLHYTPDGKLKSGSFKVYPYYHD